MPLDATRMVDQGHLIHDDILQFVDLFTGVMTDQPVTFNNSVFAASLDVGGTLDVYGGPSTFLFGAIMSNGAWQGPGAVPPGGAAGQVLMKNTVTDYDLTWGAGGGGGANIDPWYVDATTKAFLVTPDNTYDIGASAGTSPRDIYYGRRIISYGDINLLSWGGVYLYDSGDSSTADASLLQLYPDTVQTATKGAGVANDLNLGTNGTSRWRLGATTGHLLAVADNTYDIGAFGANRPRNVIVGTMVVLPAGTSSSPSINFAGAPLTGIYQSGLNELAISSVGNQIVKIAASAVTVNQPITMSGGGTGTYAINIYGSWGSYGISVHPTLTNTSGVMGIQSQISVAAGVTTADGVYSWLYLLSTGVALANASLLHAAPSVLGTNTVANMRGVYVENMGASSVSNAYGVYINAQSGAASTNVGLYNGGTTTLMNAVGIGNTSQTYANLYVGGTGITAGTNQFGVYIHNTVTSAATASAVGVDIQVWTQNAAFTTASITGLWVRQAQVPNTTTVSTVYGIHVDNQGYTSRISTIYGIYIENQSGASSNNIGLYNNGTSQLQGAVGVGTNPDPANWSLRTGSAPAHFNNVVIDNALGYGPTLGAMLTLAGSPRGNGQSGIDSRIYFDGASMGGASGSMYSMQWTLNGGTYTISEVSFIAMNGLYGGIPGGTAVNAAYGLKVSNLGGTGIANVYGVYIAAQSGAATDNIGLYNSGTTYFSTFVAIGYFKPDSTSLLKVANAGSAVSKGIMSVSGPMLASTSGCFSLNVSAYIQDAGVAVGTYAALMLTLQSSGATNTGSIAAAIYIQGSQGAFTGFTNSYGIRVENQGQNGGMQNAYGVYLNSQYGGSVTNTILWLATSSGTGSNIINSAVGATLTTAGAWANAPSWAAQKSNIAVVPEIELDRWFDWLTTDHQPVRYRHPMIRNDEGEVMIFTPEGDYDHFGFLLDDVPQDVREVWCTNESGGLSTKDTEGFLLAMLKVSGQRIKSLESRLAALEVA